MTETKVKNQKETSNSNEIIPVEKGMVSFVTFTPEKKQEFALKVEDLKKEVKVFKISDQPTRVKASEFLSRIKKAYNFLEDKRKVYVSPFIPGLRIYEDVSVAGGRG